MPLTYENGELREMTPEEVAEQAAREAGILESARRAKRRELDAAYEARLAEGFAYDGRQIALDEGSQRRITSAFAVADDAEAGGIAWSPQFAWRTNDNTYLSLPTPADFKTFARMASTAAVDLQFAVFAKRDQLAAATTLADIAAVDLETWPA